MIIRKLAYYLSFFPFRLNFFLFAGFAIVALYFVKHHYYISDTNFGYTLEGFFIFLAWMAGLLLAIAFTTAFACWLTFLIKKPKKDQGHRINVQFGENIHAEAGEVPVTIELPGALRPFLGFVKSRIIFSDLSRSGPIILDREMKQRRQIWRSGIKGTQKIWLPDRRDYLVSKGMVFFQDMFQMFSFPYKEELDKRMYTTPPQQAVRELSVQPQRTEQEETRIETLKKVEGEFLNYKNFESSDDVRRIVWKIYARNRELVVRIPEIMDPYASHINFFPSFYNGMGKSNTDKYNTEMLNLYKDHVRNIYESIMSQGAELRYIADQEILQAFTVDEKEKAIYRVSTSRWQSDRDLKSYYNTTEAAVVCVSSLVPADDVRSMLESRSRNTTVIYIRTSPALESRWPFSLQRLFVSLPPNPLNKLKRRWLISRYRRSVLRNEKELQEVLSQHNVQSVTI
jgi:predicted outer membrane lipoprotein